MESVVLEKGTSRVELVINDGKVYLKQLTFNGQNYVDEKMLTPLSTVFITGGNYPPRNFNSVCIEGEKLNYISHFVDDDNEMMIIEEGNKNIYVNTMFEIRNGSSIVSCVKSVKNISNEDICIECVNPLTICGLLTDASSLKLPAIYVANNTHCAEFSFKKCELEDSCLAGFTRSKRAGKVAFSSNGTQTTSEYLPLGIIEKDGKNLFYEIMPTGAWNYELSIVNNRLCLALSGKTLYRNGWFKKLSKDESYSADRVLIYGANDIESIAEELTKYRRSQRRFDHDLTDKVIYNNFMQNTFAEPNEDIDGKCIEFLKKVDPDYYVLDAGWHDEGNRSDVVTKIGKWNENHDNYPSGLNTLFQKIRSNGMKPGLWLEIQSVGVNAENVEIPEECYMLLNGIKVSAHARYQLDFRKDETWEYASGIVKKLVEKYDPKYIKIDYNQTQTGADCEDGSYVEGLARHSSSYYVWATLMRKTYPDIIFECCASGGMCLDEKSLAVGDVVSVSDLENYLYYPHMVKNLSLAVLPEKAGIWVMPVRKGKTTSREEIVYNVSNAFYTVMHLASNMSGMSDEEFALLNEGIKIYKDLSHLKNNSYPLIVGDLARNSDNAVVTGMRTEEGIYFTVFASDSDETVSIDLSKYGKSEVVPVYPLDMENAYSFNNGIFEIAMQKATARTFKIK